MSLIETMQKHADKVDSLLKENGTSLSELEEATFREATREGMRTAEHARATLEFAASQTVKILPSVTENEVMGAITFEAMKRLPQ